MTPTSEVPADVPANALTGLRSGQLFHGRYEVVRCIASGGMGAVYECIHVKTRKRRALKIMLPQIVADPTLRGRFELEARVTADIESEHIVETFDAGVDEETGAPFLVMELLRGEDLATMIEQRGRVAPEEVVLLLSQAALALDKTHAAGIVHRDLKPENLFVTRRDDGSPRLKILDFGIAKVVVSSQPQKATGLVGTPLYMAPEQIDGDAQVGPRTDLYSLGQIGFALLAGFPYWQDELESTPAVFAFLRKVVEGPVEAASARASRRGVALPPEVDLWFSRATSKAPKDRPETASELVRELARALGVSGLAAAGPAGPAPIAAPERESRASLPTLAPETAAVPSSLGRAPTIVVARATPAAAPTPEPAPPASPKRGGLVAFAVLVAAGSAGLYLALRSPPAPVPSPAGSASGAPTAPAEVSAAPVVSATPGPVVSVGSAAPSASASAGASAAPSASASVKRSPVGLLPKPKANCDPPYELDAAGHRKMKPQCL